MTFHMTTFDWVTGKGDGGIESAPNYHCQPRKRCPLAYLLTELLVMSFASFIRISVRL